MPIPNQFHRLQMPAVPTARSPVGYSTNGGHQPPPQGLLRHARENTDSATVRNDAENVGPHLPQQGPSREHRERRSSRRDGAVLGNIAENEIRPAQQAAAAPEAEAVRHDDGV